MKTIERAWVLFLVAMGTVLGVSSAVAQPSSGGQAPLVVQTRTVCQTLMVDMSGSMAGFVSSDPSTLTPYSRLLRDLTSLCGGTATPFTDKLGVKQGAIWKIKPTGGSTAPHVAVSDWFKSDVGKSPGSIMILVTDNVADMPSDTNSDQVDFSCKAASTNQLKPVGDQAAQRDFICALRDPTKVAAATVIATRLPFDGLVYNLNDDDGVDYEGPRALAIYVIRSGRRELAARASLDEMQDVVRRVSEKLEANQKAIFAVNPFDPMAAVNNGQKTRPEAYVYFNGDWKRKRPFVISDIPLGSRITVQVALRLQNGDLWRLNDLQGKGSIEWAKNSDVNSPAQIVWVTDGRQSVFFNLRSFKQPCKPLEMLAGQSAPKVSLGPSEIACPIVNFELDGFDYADSRGFFKQFMAWVRNEPIVAKGNVRLEWTADRSKLQLAADVQSAWSVEAGTELGTPNQTVQGRLYRFDDILRMAVTSEEESPQTVAFSPETIPFEINFIPGSGFWLTALIPVLLVISAIAGIFWIIGYLLRTIQVSITLEGASPHQASLAYFDQTTWGHHSLSRIGPWYELKSGEFSKAKLGLGTFLLQGKPGTSPRTARVLILEGNQTNALKKPQVRPSGPPLRRPPR